jgi:uncharacterized membrane protein (DUF373 family)
LGQFKISSYKGNVSPFQNTLSQEEPKKITDFMALIVDYLVIFLAIVMIIGLVIALYKVALDLQPIIVSSTFDLGSKNFVIDTLSTFVILELLLGFLQYHGANRVAPTYILDAGLFFVTRELMIELYSGSIAFEDLLSFGAVIGALGLTRILISRSYRDEKNSQV